MLTSFDAAKYFLSLVNEDEGDLVSNLKLQKLVYYAQTVHLALHNAPLFPEAVVAWQHGPVVPDLYHEYKQYGQGAIPLPDDLDLEKFSAEERDVLNEVYTVFGQFSAWKLRDMTHQDGPWKDVPINGEITQDAMREYGLTLVK